MSEEIKPVKPANPLDIPAEKVKVLSMLHKCSPQEAFAAILGKDLLERLDGALTVEELKPIIKVLVTSVVGDGTTPDVKV